MTPEFGGQRDRMPCPTCGGMGVCDSIADSASMRTVRVVCWTCEGRGWVPTRAQEPEWELWWFLAGVLAWLTYLIWTV